MFPSIASTLLVIFVPLLLLALFASWCFRRYLLSVPTQPQVPMQSGLSPILLMSATAISKKLRSGELSSYNVVKTFIDHATRVNPYLNVIVFERFAEALEEARQADRLLERIRKAGGREPGLDPGWLLGVPCTVKECMSVAGCPHSSGHVARRDLRAAEDSPVVRRIRAAGAIVIGVTNTSELCMWMESHNKVYGISRNAYDVRCIVGGSSGGEASAVAALFAPFGIGSDIGGSIRLPCFFNGVFGHKPSTRLVPNQGQCPTVKSSGHYLMVTGPICRHAEDLLPLLRIMAAGGFLEDPQQLPPCPHPEPLPALDPMDNYSQSYSDRIITRLSSKGPMRLRVYAIEDLGLLGIYVSRSQVRIVREAAQRLARNLGAEVQIINFRCLERCSGSLGVPPGWDTMKYALQMWSSLMTHHEPTFSELVSEPYGNDRISPYRELLRWLAGWSDHTLPAILLMLFEKAAAKINSEKMNENNRRMAKDLSNNIHRVLGPDGVIICPTFPEPAPRHHKPTLRPFQYLYTALFNALQLPVTAVPIWDALACGINAPDTLDARRLGIHGNFARDYHLPRGLQVVGAWGNDALTVSVAIELERLFGGYKPPAWAHFT